MARPKKYQTNQVIAAIRGTRGIKSVICERLGCHLETLNIYLAENPTIAQAYAEENELMLDLAESVLYRNIQMEAQRQVGVPAQGAPDGPNYVPPVPPMSADTADAKWVLSRKGRARGFGDHVEVETPSPYGDMSSEEIAAEIAELLAKAEARRKKGQGHAKKTGG